MKVTINNEKGIVPVHDRTYPYIGVCGKIYVLFISKETGIELTDTHSSEHRYSKMWVEENFIVLDPSVSITISNEAQEV